MKNTKNSTFNVIKNNLKIMKQKINDDRTRNATLSSGIDELFVNSSLDNYDIEQCPKNKKSFDIVKKYCSDVSERLKGRKGLLLIGPAGVGKTHLACAVMSKVISHCRYSCYFISSSDLIDLMKDAMDNSLSKERVDRIYDVDFLVLDDFLLDINTEWARDRLYQLIDYRYKKMKITIYTTNLTLKDMEKEFGYLAQRAIGRLVDTSVVLALVDDDYRFKRKK